MMIRSTVSVCVLGLLLFHVSCSGLGGRPQIIDGHWELLRLRGKAVIEGYFPLTAEFQPDGRLQCHGGVNYFGGNYRSSGNSITIHVTITTLIGGSRELMQQEIVFQQVMEQASTFRVEDNAQLTLRNAEGQVLALFRNVSP